MAKGSGAMIPKMVKHGQCDKHEWDVKTEKDEFNRIRWENVDKQLAEIKACWVDQTEPMWAMLTVETGFHDFKKIGLEMREQCLTGEFRMAFMKQHQAMKDLMRGRTAKSAGDMDDYIEINSHEELTAEHLKSKSTVLQQDISLVATKLDFDEPVVKRASYKPAAPAAPGPAGSSVKVREILRGPLAEVKMLGLNDDQMLEIVRDLWKDLPGPAAAPPAGPSGRPGAGDLELWLRKTRESDGLAWLVFHLQEDK